MSRRGVTALALAVACAAGCSNIQLDPPAEIIHARFDPDAKVIPMPTDILRDADANRLDIPTDDADLTDAEREFYTFLDTLDGWSSAMAATVEFTAPVNPQTINADTVQVWQWRATPQLVDGVRVSLSDDETKLTIDAPRTGWERGGKYFVVVRGGDAGVEGKRGEKVEADAAFYFLRLTQRLDTPEHERAFPGDTRAERQDNASKLEDIREDLAPFFDFFEARGIPRDDVAALWSFTVTDRTELAMDKSSQRMPLPIDLLIDPDTGKVDLPVAPWDSQVEADAKVELHDYDGFGTSANLLFGFTGPIDAATITPDSVQLYEATNPPTLIPATPNVLQDQTHIELVPDEQPLKERTRYAVVVKNSVRDADGKPIIVMPVGHFLESKAPIYVNGESQVGAVDADDARKLEPVREDVESFLGDLGDTSDVLSAWTFTTMTVKAPMEELVKQPELLKVSPDPTDVTHMTPAQASADFPLGFTSLIGVGDVYNGEIESPIFLDPITRGWRTDGSYDVQKIPFTMTIPRSAQPGKPLPVVIFGHGIMCERRFVLSVSEQLAERGFAAIAIDLPYHGERTYCWSEGPLSVPDPQTGELTPLSNPCQDGYTCNDDGRCVDAAGQGNHLAYWPVVGMPSASGAAFIEIEHIANTRDHFRQAVVDLASLSRSLQKGDWESVIGMPIETDEIDYLGQSLGGIIGATFVSLSPEIKRAVLNVPGADTVDLFKDSPTFGGQVQAFFTRQHVDPESFEGHRFLDVARWFMDSADPAGVADHLLDNGRKVLLQMATLDFIIPNQFTEKLQAISGAPRLDYVAEHAFLVIPVEPEYLHGSLDMANFMAGTLQP